MSDNSIHHNIVGKFKDSDGKVHTLHRIHHSKYSDKAHEFKYTLRDPDKHTVYEFPYMEGHSSVKEKLKKRGYKEMNEEIKVGDNVIASFKKGWNTGYKGKVTKIDGDYIHGESDMGYKTAFSGNKNYKKTWKAHKNVVKKVNEELNDIKTHGNTKGKDLKKYKKRNETMPVKGHYKNGTSGSEEVGEVKLKEEHLEEIVNILIDEGYSDEEIEDIILNESHSEHDLWDHYHSRAVESWEKIGKHLEDQANLQNKMMKNSSGEHAPYISVEQMKAMCGHLDNALEHGTRHTEGIGYSLKNILNMKKLT